MARRRRQWVKYQGRIDARALVFLAAWSLSIAASAWAVYAFYWGKHVG